MIFSSDALALLDMGDMFVLLECQILVHFLLGILRTSHFKEGQGFAECVIVLCTTQRTRVFCLILVIYIQPVLICFFSWEM